MMSRMEFINAILISFLLCFIQPDIVGAHFTWNGMWKDLGSFFVGTSPEFDLAIYTICGLLHRNSQCHFTLQGHSVSIQTWDVGHKAGNQIASAYPIL
jgi:poly(U)-specific endoribonuclease